MNTKDKVIESQRKIIDALAECEFRIGSLYQKYAACFPAMKTQWLGLAAAEKAHCDLLKTMHRILDKGSTFYNLGKFGEQALRPTVSLVDDSLKKADAPGFALGDALCTALEIESSLIESHFYDVITSDAPEFRVIAQRLSSDTRRHVETLRDHFHKAG